MTNGRDKWPRTVQGLLIILILAQNIFINTALLLGY